MSLRLSQGYKVLLAASMVSMALGSIHAFSVFLGPLETMFNVSRASSSLVYSFSLVFLTVSVLFGPVVYARLSPATIYLLVAVLGAAGACLAGLGGSLVSVFVGYSFIFGIANGLGYGFGLQFAARANPARAGFAMGVVTAAYAFGAVLAPYAFTAALTHGGFSHAMIALGSVVLVVGVSSAAIVARSEARYANVGNQTPTLPLPFGQIALIWIAYGCGVAAGLMAIGHAAGMAEVAGFSGWVAAALVAGCNLFGSLLCGWLSDRASHRAILAALPLIGFVALIGLSAFPNLSNVFLGFVGFAYGGTIATYPAAISKLFPGENGPRAYGQVFTAWGIAGLIAPWLAGNLYDGSESYQVALYVAAALCIASAVTAGRVFPSK